MCFAEWVADGKLERARAVPLQEDAAALEQDRSWLAADEGEATEATS